MALIDRNRTPTSRDLRVFGILFTTFCAGLGALVLYRTGSWTIAAIIWTVGLLISALYHGVPATRTMIFHAWMAAVFPIGWLISHALLAVIYYGVITPIGLALRLWNGDLLNQKRNLLATTYWVPCSQGKGVRRYFQQF